MPESKFFDDFEWDQHEANKQAIKAIAQRWYDNNQLDEYLGNLNRWLFNNPKFKTRSLDPKGIFCTSKGPSQSLQTILALGGLDYIQKIAFEVVSQTQETIKFQSAIGDIGYGRDICYKEVEGFLKTGFWKGLQPILKEIFAKLPKAGEELKIIDGCADQNLKDFIYYCGTIYILLLALQISHKQGEVR